MALARALQKAVSMTLTKGSEYEKGFSSTECRACNELKMVGNIVRFNEDNKNSRGPLTQVTNCLQPLIRHGSLGFVIQMVVVVDMEGKYHTPHLNKVLKRYQMYAGNTLCGPSAVLSRLDNATSNSSTSSSTSSSPNSVSQHEPERPTLVRRDMEEPTLSLLHQQLQQQQTAPNRTTRVEPIIEPAHRSSIVPNRRVSDNILEIRHAADTLRNPLITRSRSSPGEADIRAYRLVETPVNLSPQQQALRTSLSTVMSRPSHPPQHIRQQIIREEWMPLGFHQQQPPNQHPPPIFSAADSCWTELEETLLEGKRISCFVIGGEKRLCLPQCIHSVLTGIDLNQINPVCDELQIFCSLCSKDQVEALKASKVIPPTAKSCGLITKSDAERLVNALLYCNPPQAAIPGYSSATKGSKSHFKVYHKCFGKCKGIVNLQLYNQPDARCIECADCHGLFSPARFVAHSHKPTENRTCHWGFDSANWRHYLLLRKDQEDYERLEQLLKDFKAKFDQKRKESRTSPAASDDTDDLCDIRAKKSRLHDPEIIPSLPPVGSLNMTPNGATKLPPLGQYSPVDNAGGSGVSLGEVERMKKMLLYKLEEDEGAEACAILDKLTKKISQLEQICRCQAKFIKDVSQEMAGGDHQTNSSSTTSKTAAAAEVVKIEKLSSGASSPTTPTRTEAEPHCLKKNLLRRHNECAKV